MTMSWDDTVAAFAKALPGYSERASQTALAHEMEAAFEAKEPLLGQAPPGTGKSYPAIAVLMDRSIESTYPSVVSTATKALQDQYIADCRKIRKHVFPQFRFMVLKGRSNYLCRSKMSKADEVLLGLPQSIDEINRIAEDDDVIGDVDRLGFELDYKQRRALTTTSEECPGKSTCKFGATCFAEKAKAKAEQSHVIIVNHAMLAVDAVLRDKTQGMVSLLPSYPYLVVDEAHEMRGYVESALSTTITRWAVTALVNEVANFTDDLELVQFGRIAADPLFRQLDNILGPPDSITGRTDQQPLVPAIIGELAPNLIKLYEFLQELDGKAALVKVYGDDEVDRKNRLRKRVQGLTERVGKVMADPFSDTVRWLERDRVESGQDLPALQLCTAPLDVAPFLNDAIWSETTPVLLSATLAIGDDFRFMAHEHGIDLAGKYRTFDCPTPFDFKSQAVTYIPAGIPDLRTNYQGHLAAFVMQNMELIRAAGGRSMLLFNSWDGLDTAYRNMRPELEALGLTVFKQGDMTSTRALADAFRDDETSVLFGTKSFFTGVNIEGNSLLYLGIHKNPFHYPDVLWKARCDAIDAPLSDRERSYKGSFTKLSLPDMTMTLIQGYGRLIRSVSDRGVVGLFDTSLSVQGGKRYGATVRKQLPPAPVVTNLREAVDNLKRLRAEIEDGVNA
jgi:ATP-dependent DNA helicase DinG